MWFIDGDVDGFLFYDVDYIDWTAMWSRAFHS